MKILFILIVLSAAGWFAYQTVEQKHENAALRNQIASLEKTNEDLKAQVDSENTEIEKTSTSQANRLADLKSRLDAETGKLQALKDQKHNLQDALSDPAKATSNREIDAQIKDRKEQIVAFENQIHSNQESEHDLEQNGVQAKGFQKIAGQNSLTALNEQIETQQNEIKATETSIQNEKHSNDLYRAQNVQNLKDTLSKQKADLEAQKIQRKTITQSTSINTNTIQQLMDQEKKRIKTTIHELHDQIDAVKIEIKALDARRGNTQATLNNLKSQISDLDSKIKSQQQIIDDLQTLIKKEQ